MPAEVLTWSEPTAPSLEQVLDCTTARHISRYPITGSRKASHFHDTVRTVASVDVSIYYEGLSHQRRINATN